MKRTALLQEIKQVRFEGAYSSCVLHWVLPHRFTRKLPPRNVAKQSSGRVMTWVLDNTDRDHPFKNCAKDNLRCRGFSVKCSIMWNMDSYLTTRV